MWLSIGQIFSSANQTVQKRFGFGRQSVNALFEKELFASGPDLPNISRVLSGNSMGNTWLVGDYTSLYRASQDLAVEVWQNFPEAPLGFLKDFISSKDIGLGYHAFGSASSLNVIIGLVQLKEAFDQVAFAKAIGDRKGILTGRLSCIQAGSILGAGISFGIYRPVSMIGVINDSSTASLIGRVSYGAVQAGLACYAVFFAALTTILGIQVYDGASFIKGLDNAQDLAAKVEYLQKTLNVDPKKVHQKFIDKHGEKKAAELLIDEALKAGKSSIRSMMKEMGIDQIHEEKLEEIVREAVKKGCWGFTSESIQRQLNEKLMLVGLSMRVQKTQIKQSGNMQGILGRAGFDALKEVASLKGRVSKTDVKAQSLVDKIRASAKGKLTENALVLSVCALGIIAMIAAMVFTGGIPIIVSSVIMLVFSVLMTIVDWYYLYESYRDERPAPHDKKMVIFSTIVGVSSLLALVALGLSGVVTMGIFPIVVASILSALWIGQNAVTWWIINRNEMRHDVRNPTLETFIKALSDDRYKKKIMKMFGNLPKELQKQIQLALKSTENDMKKAAISVAREVDKVKEQRLEMLRMALAPYLVNEMVS